MFSTTFILTNWFGWLADKNARKSKDGFGMCKLFPGKLFSRIFSTATSVVVESWRIKSANQRVKPFQMGALRVKALYGRLKYIFSFCIFKNLIEVFIFDATIDSVKQGKDQTHENEKRRITTEWYSYIISNLYKLSYEISKLSQMLIKKFPQGMLLVSLGSQIFAEGSPLAVNVNVKLEFKWHLNISLNISNRNIVC